MSEVELVLPKKRMSPRVELGAKNIVIALLHGVANSKSKNNTTFQWMIVDGLWHRITVILVALLYCRILRPVDVLLFY